MTYSPAERDVYSGPESSDITQKEVEFKFKKFRQT